MAACTALPGLRPTGCIAGGHRRDDHRRGERRHRRVAAGASSETPGGATAEKATKANPYEVLELDVTASTRAVRQAGELLSIESQRSTYVLYPPPPPPPCDCILLLLRASVRTFTRNVSINAASAVAPRRRRFVRAPNKRIPTAAAP
jgi:hypothetical protein